MIYMRETHKLLRNLKVFNNTYSLSENALVKVGLKERKCFPETENGETRER